MSDEQKRKVSLSKKGQSSPRKGVILSQEIRDRISLSKIGIPSPKKGIKLSAEQKARLNLSGLEKGRYWNKGTKGVMKSNKTSFKKGLVAWNKGKKGLYVGWGKGMKFPDRSGEKHHNWKGGHSLHPKYHRAYSIAYKARKRHAIGFFSTLEWESLKQKYNFMCLCCKKFEPEILLSADHIVPLAKGGTNYISNIQPLCTRCNSIKGTKEVNYIYA